MTVKFFYVILITIFGFLSAAQQPPELHQHVPSTQDMTWMESAGNGLTRSLNFLDDNVELIQLVQALAHLPYILMVDSTNPKVIRSTSMINGNSIAIKVIYELARARPEQRFGLVRNLLLDAPKVCLLLLSMGYDVIRFLDAGKIAFNNKTNGHKLSVFKINQCAQLFVEIFLRVITFVLQRQARSGQGNLVMAGVASEVADVIALWRLLSRFSTYFLYTKQLSFNVTLSRIEDSLPAEDKLDEKELAALTEFAKEHTEEQKETNG